MINSVTLIGNVGKNPEVRQVNEQVKVANFSVATTDSYKDKEGNWQEITEWHNIRAFGKIVDFIEIHVKKGDKIYLSGMIKTDKWEKDGIARYTTYICVNKFEHTIKKLNWEKKDGSVPPNTVYSDPLPPSESADPQQQDELPF